MNFNQVISNLEQNGFFVSVFDTKEEAAAYLNREIDGVTVGHGGSMTLKEMNLPAMLATHNELYSHWSVPEGMTKEQVMQKAQSAQVYLSSVNALAETGEIVNIDGTCNRISGMVFGHERVYFVVGENKLAPDYDSALYRARNVAAPRNAQRLKRNTPCAAEGNRCYNCNSPDRICAGLSVLWKAPHHCRFEVVLIREALGY